MRVDSKYTVNKIAEVMRDKGIRQIDLARALGVSQFVVSHWFTATSSESYMTHLDKIAKFLGVSMDYLVGNKVTLFANTGKEQEEIIHEISNREELFKLLQAATSATDSEITLVTEILKLVKEKDKQSEG